MTFPHIMVWAKIWSRSANNPIAETTSCRVRVIDKICDVDLRTKTELMY